MRWAAMALLALTLAGCTSQTELGRCVGLNGRKDPALVYEYSARNIILGIVFMELVAPPVLVVLNQLECPVSRVTEGSAR